MMKQWTLLLTLVLVLGVTGGCGKKRIAVNPQVNQAIAVLTLDGDLPNQTGDQERELNRVIEWMDRDLIRNMQKSGLQPILIKDMEDYKAEMGTLLVVDVEHFNAGNRAARAFIGFGAGAASLDLYYKLLDKNGTLLAEWRDGVGSSMGGTYCAQTLNRRALAKVVGILNN